MSDRIKLLVTELAKVVNAVNGTAAGSANPAEFDACRAPTCKSLAETINFTSERVVDPTRPTGCPAMVRVRAATGAERTANAARAIEGILCQFFCDHTNIVIEGLVDANGKPRTPAMFVTVGSAATFLAKLVGRLVSVDPSCSFATSNADEADRRVGAHFHLAVLARPTDGLVHIGPTPVVPPQPATVYLDLFATMTGPKILRLKVLVNMAAVYNASEGILGGSDDASLAPPA